MYNRLELALLLKNAYPNFKIINKVINKSIENGIYEDEKILIMASKMRSGTYTCNDIYEFEFEWK